ncbi:TIGR02391 family protein, partial [Paenibacillus chitinolyticus]
LLVDEIPIRQRTGIAIAVILQRKKGDIYNLGYFIEALFDKLEDIEIFQVYKVISEELKYTDSDESIRTILHIVPAKYWNKVDKVVKIRIENLLFENVKSGKYDTSNKKCRFGSLGTWIKTEHLLNFEDINQWTTMIVDKLRNGDVEEKAYIQTYLWNIICEANKENINYSLKYYFSEGLKNENKEIVGKLEFQIMFEEHHPWWKVFEEELKKYPEILNTQFLY